MTVTVNRREMDQMVAGVARRFGVLSWQDAEDAVQQAWLESLERERRGAGPAGGGGVVTLAHFRASNTAQQRRRRPTASLEALHEATGDAFMPSAADALEDQVDARVRLAHLTERLRAELLEAARAGDGMIRPRGEGSGDVRYSNAEVERWRAARRAGESYGSIARWAGRHPECVRRVCLRVERAATACAGWSPELVVDALRAFARREGRPPSVADSSGNPALPSQGTAERHFGSWRAALAAAGLPVTPWRRPRATRWTREAMIAAIRGFHDARGRWPQRRHFERREEGLPARSTVQRMFGSVGAGVRTAESSG